MTNICRYLYSQTETDTKPDRWTDRVLKEQKNSILTSFVKRNNESTVNKNCLSVTILKVVGIMHAKPPKY